MRLIENLWKERIAFMRDTMLDLCEVDIMPKDRRYVVVVARAIVADRLVKDGMKFCDIAELLKKNHATIIYYVDLVKNITSIPGYKAERELYRKFNKIVNEYDSGKNRQGKN